MKTKSYVGLVVFLLGVNITSSAEQKHTVDKTRLIPSPTRTYQLATPKTQRLPLKKDRHWSYLALPPFYAIRAVGNIHLMIHGRKNRSSAWVDASAHLLEGHPQHSKKAIWVQNGVLFIHYCHYQAPIKLVLNMPYVRQFDVYGKVRVIGDHLKGQDLIIKDYSQEKLTLSGQMQVKRVDVESSGPVYLHWVKSPRLLIQVGGHGVVHMAGIAQHLSVRLFDHAKLDAQYLRANDMMIETEQWAKARVFAIRSLNAFANGHSQINFYHTPHSFNQVTRQSGMIFQVDWRR